MVNDRFGNYVVQKMIEYAEPKKKDDIIRRLSESNALKKRDGYSKHVLSFLEKNKNISQQYSSSSGSQQYYKK